MSAYSSDRPVPAGATRRAELIVRLDGLTEDQAQRIADVLAPTVRRLGGRMSEVVRDEFSDHAMHVRRRRIV